MLGNVNTLTNISVNVFMPLLHCLLNCFTNCLHGCVLFTFTGELRTVALSAARKANYSDCIALEAGVQSMMSLSMPDVRWNGSWNLDMRSSMSRSLSSSLTPRETSFNARSISKR